MKKVAIISFVAALSGAANAEEIYWNNPVSGLWSDGANWSLTREPGDDDSISIEANGEYTVTMPAELTFMPTLFKVQANNNSTITIDGRGGIFHMPARPSGSADVYNSEPWGIRTSSGHFFNLETYNTAPAPNGAHAVVFMTNYLMRVACSSQGARLDIDSGYFNFHDPDGVSYSHPFTMFAQNQPGGIAIYAHAGSHLRLPVLNMRGNSVGGNLLCFDGGEHEILDVINMPSGNFTPGNKSTTELKVTGEGTKLSTMSLNIGALYSGTQTSSNRIFKVTVDNGGEMTINSTFKHTRASQLFVRVADGGKMTVNNEMDMGSSAFTTSKVEVINGTFDSPHYVYVGNGTYENAYASLVATNANMTQSHLYLNLGENEIVNSQSKFTDFYVGHSCNVEEAAKVKIGGGTMDINTFYCGTTYKGEVVIEDGAEVTANKCEVGFNANANGKLTINDAKVKLPVNTTYVGKSGKGELTINDGAEVEVTGYGLYIGGAVGSEGLMTMNGGKLTISMNEGLLIGQSGRGTYIQNGGEVTTVQVRTGWQSTAGEEHTFIMNGGKLRITTVDNNVGFNICDGGGADGTVILNGGEMYLPRIRGWNGTGFSKLVGNGCKLFATAGVTGKPFMNKISDATLTARGLAINSMGFNIEIDQDFTDAEGEEGMLLLTGDGNKTIKSASHQATLVLAGGTTIFAEGADQESHLIVTNSATLKMNGALNVNALTLGTDGLANISYSAGDVIVCASEPTLGICAITLNETLPEGLHPIIVSKGVVSAATQSAWNGKVFITAGDANGYDYIFDTSYDEVKDETTFYLNVTTTQPLDAATIWQGETSQITDALNWGGALPLSTGVAEFGANGATTSVNVDDDFTTTLLKFNGNANYTLAGNGALHLANSGNAAIEAAGGEQKMLAKLQLQKRVDVNVAQGAKLELAQIEGGGFNKVGDGTLKLTSNDSSLIAGVKNLAGLMTMDSVSALGCTADTVQKMLTLSGGTVEIKNTAAETLPYKLTVEAPAVNNAVVLKNDGALTVRDIQVLSGALIKRGAGRLTIASTTESALNLSSGNGECAQNGVPTANVIPFNDDGAVPTKGYAGLNVAEGEMLITGAGSQIVANNAICIGLPTANGTAEPALTVDGATVMASVSNYHLLLGANAYTEHGIFWSEPRLTVCNGGSLTVNTLNVGKAGSKPIKPIITLDNGTLYGSWSLNISERASLINSIITARNGSKLLSANALNWRGPASVELDNSIFAMNTQLAGVGIEINNGGNGEWYMHNGAKFCCNYITNDSYNQISFRFNDAEWKSGTLTNFSFIRSDHLNIITEGERGLIMAPTDGTELRMAKAITGTGNMTKRGAGTLRFVTQEIIQNDNVLQLGDSATSAAYHSQFTLDFDGALNIEEGSVIVEAGAARTNAVFAGCGTLTAAGLVKPTLKVGDEVLTLDGFESEGVVTLDLGRTAENAIARPFPTLTVARYTGTAPDVSKFTRVINTGTSEPLEATCVAANGVITATLRAKNRLMIILR